MVTDAFGGIGGIAAFNRDFITTLAQCDDIQEIIAIPRLVQREPEPTSHKVKYLGNAVNSRLRYAGAVLRTLASRTNFDAVICAHLNLLPLAFLASRWTGAKLVLSLYGVEAWSPPKWLIRQLVRRVDAFISISALTKRRFIAWSGVDESKVYILPCSFDPRAFSPGEKNPKLLQRYGIRGNSILMTCGRLASTERQKGFDEVLEALPDILKAKPDVRYVIVGEGDDRPRLQKKAENLGLKDVVVFTGYIAECEKPDHFRLADAYVMPSRQEGFGIVYLEALACGIPTIAGNSDSGAEVLQGGNLGRLVDPSDRAALIAAILELIDAPKRVPEGLSYFSLENYATRLNYIWSTVISAKPSQGNRHE